MKRNNRVDVMRGIAITLVVFEHALGSSLVSVQNVILSFHMPLFFIISGFFAKKVYKTGIIKDIKKKIRTILIPQITLSVISLLYNIVVSYGILHTIELNEINYMSYLFGYWFLHVMWQVTVLWELLSCFFIKNSKKTYTFLIILLVYFFFIPAGIKGTLYVAVTPIALGFYILGFLLHDKGLLEQKRWFIDFILFVFLCIIGMLNGRVLMYENQYGNKCLFLLTSICGFFLVNDISSMLKNSRILSWIGRNSIIIYVVHFHIVQGIRGVLMRVAEKFTNYSLFGIAVFLISFVIILCITLVCERYFGVLFGRSSYKKNGRK